MYAYIYIYIFIHTTTHIYIYIYMHVYTYMSPRTSCGRHSGSSAPSSGWRPTGKYRVQGLGFRVQVNSDMIVYRYRVQGLGFRVQVNSDMILYRYRVQGLGNKSIQISSHLRAGGARAGILHIVYLYCIVQNYVHTIIYIYIFNNTYYYTI